MIERFGVALQGPVEFGAHGLDVGDVDRDAGRTAGALTSTTSKKVRLPRTTVEILSRKGDSGVAEARIFSRATVARSSRPSLIACRRIGASTASP
jgi:hypothetical protein